VACWLVAKPWETSSGAKNSKMGTLKKNFQKPWGSIYSTEMFSKMVFGQMEMTMEEKGVGGFTKDIGDH
jgi:hypothetical protein